MRSLYSGVSGLNNHQTRMDVIGNNIANVNTYGFKKGRANFQDILSQTLAGAARPTAEKGGINPKQVGLGMSVAAIDTIHTQGALKTSGVNTDLAITGEGFFVMKNGEETFYTRNGALGLDKDGLLVNPANGFKLQGYRAVENADGSTTIDVSSTPEDLKIPIGKKVDPEATSYIKYKCNLNNMTPAIADYNNATEKEKLGGTWKTSIETYDSRGNLQEVQLNFRKAVDANGREIQNKWRVDTRVIDKQGREINDLQAAVNPDSNNASSSFYVNFNTKGAITAIESGDNNRAGEQPFRLEGNGRNLSVNLSYNMTGSDPMNIQLDLGTAGEFDGITQTASKSSTKAVEQNGVAMGYLEGFQIDDIGIITGVFTNGIKKPLGRVALANFTNPGGLSKVGETNFIETNNSGRALVNPAGDNIAGNLKAGTLEMSNVDLSREFTEMIVTQRGFQANSRTITTSDSMLQEILRLKR